MKIKTQELDGAALDWAVATCDGATFELKTRLSGGGFQDFVVVAGKRYSWRSGQYALYSPPNDWSQGGPIIYREGISTHLCPDGKTWFAVLGDRTIHADTPLIAAMRCYVASKLGDEVDIPGELLK